MPHLDPTSCWPSLAGPGSQLDPVGLQGSSLPPATHFVKGHTPRPPPAPDAAGPLGSKAGKGCGEVTGWVVVREGTLKTQNRKKTNGRTCSPPQTEAGV